MLPFRQLFEFEYEKTDKEKNLSSPHDAGPITRSVSNRLLRNAGTERAHMAFPRDGDEGLYSALNECGVLSHTIVVYLGRGHGAVLFLAVGFRRMRSFGGLSLYLSSSSADPDRESSLAN